MHVLILGADGYLGWPTAMYFSQKGWNVTAVDNYFRRNACTELDVGMLYPLPSLQERAQLWYELTGHEIKVIIGDIAEPEICRSLFTGTRPYNWAKDTSFTGLPEVIVHYAEQPSAPYSLLNYHYADVTVTNNLRVTNNLMFAVRDLCPTAHLVKLGTMGEYGTPNIDIEEGWIDIEHKGRKDTFLFPRQASSLYHTTKIMDTDLLWFGTRTWNLRVTDLMQGPVYGIDTYESEQNERLRTLFNYDEIFGTVINRFITQAIAGYPLTVYGKGGQQRGYINIKDTLQCVYKAAENPPDAGRLKIYNQIMETYSVNELAELTQKAARKAGYKVTINHIDNPRKEAEDHYYNPQHQGLLDLGVLPHYLTEESMLEMIRTVEKFRKNIRKDVIFRGIKW
ncbi:NAD-dependent epimerase/dehydratase family protein [Desulfovibrio subterraneus]|uniref:NAD-dependent epimerase/dehydratase family protein n=1 Tax=Desulfovibrio subterraneus TaxID=2718620 RepID=UPI0022B8C983|nr:NAD-dependent epimerase/dehydratase family protein [Desulfovibrio subterraneus]WBF66275.1 NAD-dependent epimerase/dehydratase family protein [Desulfovibrio subterraneus]